MNKFIVLFLISNFCFASLLNECGEYLINGKLKISKKDKIEFVIFENSTNEIRFQLNSTNEFKKISQYLNQNVEMKISIDSKKDKDEKIISNIREVRLVLKDRLKLEDDLSLLKESNCN